MRRWAVFLFSLSVLATTEAQQQLVALKRVYVAPLNGGEAAEHIRGILIAQLHAAGLFVVTENPDRADASLRGSAEDQPYTEIYQVSDTVGNSAQRSTSSFSRVLPGLGSLGGSESSGGTERRHEAQLAVRIVAKDGDIIWSTAQQSNGIKFRTAATDVAEKVTKQLQTDFRKASGTALKMVSE